MLIEMVKNILVFTPNTLDLNKSGYLEGLHRQYDDCEAYYITNAVPTIKETNQIVGYLNNLTKAKHKDFKAIHLDNLTSKVTLVNYAQNNNNIVRIVYDYDGLKNSDLVSFDDRYGIHFQILAEHVKKNRRKNDENGRKSPLTPIISALELIITVFNSIKLLWSYSATISHFYDNLTNYKWFLNELIKEKRISPKIGNFILSKLFDLTLGIFLLRLFIENEDFIVDLIEETRETIIHNFRDLLIYLMGSPIGLKLNYALNKSLGTFFFYHISLWRIFLITMQPMIKQYFKLMVLPGAFGFSYQIAMLTDLISLATFHVYCIYVYAARLIHLQLRGLLSLWRLFIGRKYNPLRQRVDSYEYSQHQLFIGTLGFTVLLFLLPTTTMYYTVFIIFRLAILIIDEILIRIRFLLHSIPIYVFILWLTKSPQMTGSVCLKWKKPKNGMANLEAHLRMLPLLSSVKKFVPDGALPKTDYSWGGIFHRIFTGILL